MAQCDLHTHSYYSDGSLSPKELLALAQAAGLSAVVLSDHNTVAGLPEFLAAGENSPVEAVPGVEFSTEYRGKELHILGVFIRPEHFDAITERMEDFRKRKEQSTLMLITALKNAGMDVDYSAIKKATPDGNVNRAHIAGALMEKGYAESVKDAFRKYLAPERGYYTPPKRMDAFEAIRFIKSLGAAAVLAHPLLNLNEEELRQFLPEAKKAGLDAMETMYSKYDAEETALAKSLAAAYGLLESGGSDFHGKTKPDIQIGTGRGNLCIDGGLLEKLKEKVQ